MVTKDTPWTNEAGTAYKIADAHRLLKTGMSSITLGTYVSLAQYNSCVAEWMKGFVQICAQKKRRVTVSITGSIHPDCFSIASHAAATGADLEFDISSALQYVYCDDEEKRKVYNEQFEQLLGKFGKMFSYNNVAVRLPLLSDDLCTATARLLANYTFITTVIAATDQMVVGNVPGKYKEALAPPLIRKIEARRMVSVLYAFLPDTTSVRAAADIASPHEADAYLCNGALGFELGKKGLQKSYERIAAEFEAPFRN